MQVIKVYNSQLQSTDHQARSIHIDPPIPVGKEFLYQLILPFLQTLYPERHPPEVGNLFLCITQSQMSQETLIIFIYFIVYQCLLTHDFLIDALLKTVDDLFQYGLVEY